MHVVYVQASHYNMMCISYQEAMSGNYQWCRSGINLNGIITHISHPMVFVILLFSYQSPVVPAGSTYTVL